MTDAKRSAEHKAPPVIRFAELDRLIDELVAVIADENALLKAGMPASLAATTGHKSNLAVAIEQQLKAISGAGPITPVERAYLDERVGLVQALARDNLSHLAGAIGASRRRISAVVAAVRDAGTATPKGYGRNGRSAAEAGRISLTSDRLA